MASSKFSSPFFQKSPLYGAYTSGADGIVPVSYDDIHKDFQKSVADNVAKHYTPKKDSCSNLDQKLADGTLKEGAHKVLSEKCAKKNKPEEEAVKETKTSNTNIPKPTPKQIAAQYGEGYDPNEIISQSNSIFNSGMVHQNHPCPPGQSRDPVTGMCGL